ncbi:MAG: hypothetical protein A2231_07705 [Candidatus Firestonebacteria bacterium RIFOXYA2_FULL_40_8]|nr:MAG: hypothetical protein A2231_07705 [Candidatus Firestonebacteria bacterium RIFOXYA2_FULL_40_8]
MENINKINTWQAIKKIFASALFVVAGYFCVVLNNPDQAAVISFSHALFTSLVFVIPISLAIVTQRIMKGPVAFLITLGIVFCVMFYLIWQYFPEKLGNFDMYYLLGVGLILLGSYGIYKTIRGLNDFVGYQEEGLHLKLNGAKPKILKWEDIELVEVTSWQSIRIKARGKYYEISNTSILDRIKKKVNKELIVENKEKKEIKPQSRIDYVVEEPAIAEFKPRLNIILGTGLLVVFLISLMVFVAWASAPNFFSFISVIFLYGFSLIAVKWFIYRIRIYQRGLEIRGIFGKIPVFKSVYIDWKDLEHVIYDKFAGGEFNRGNIIFETKDSRVSTKYPPKKLEEFLKEVANHVNIKKLNTSAQIIVRYSSIDDPKSLEYKKTRFLELYTDDTNSTEGLKLIKEILKEQPKDIEMCYYLGNIYLWGDKNKKALSQYLDCLKIDFDFQKARLKIICLSLLEGDYDTASIQFDRINFNKIEGMTASYKKILARIVKEKSYEDDQDILEIMGIDFPDNQ